MEREKMKWIVAFGRERPRALNRWGRCFFYSPTPFTFLLIVGENVARRTEAWRLGRSSCNCPDARIFETRVAAARASLHACLLVRPSLARVGRGWRVQVLSARSGACMSWTHA